MREHDYFVYIMASKRNGTLYIGVTSDLVKRVFEHKQGWGDGFTKKYGIRDLVYFAHCTDITEAIIKEKQMKKWIRQWKIDLIEKENPEWRDLYVDIT